MCSGFRMSSNVRERVNDFFIGDSKSSFAKTCSSY